jgi:hypothetical protein
MLIAKMYFISHYVSMTVKLPIDPGKFNGTVGVSAL